MPEKITSLKEAEEWFLSHVSGGVKCYTSDLAHSGVCYCYPDAQEFYSKVFHKLARDGGTLGTAICEVCGAEVTTENRHEECPGPMKEASPAPAVGGRGRRNVVIFYDHAPIVIASVPLLMLPTQILEWYAKDYAMDRKRLQVLPWLETVEYESPAPAPSTSGVAAEAEHAMTMRDLVNVAGYLETIKAEAEEMPQVGGNEATIIEMSDAALEILHRELERSPDPTACLREHQEGASSWFIERGQAENHSPTIWWRGGNERAGVGDDEMANWTTDAAEARRFATRDEADSLAGKLFGCPHDGVTMYSITEHVFLPAATGVVNDAGNAISATNAKHRFAMALRDVLVHAGVLRRDADVSGSALLLAAQDYVSSPLEGKTKPWTPPGDNTIGWSVIKHGDDKPAVLHAYGYEWSNPILPQDMFEIEARRLGQKYPESYKGPPLENKAEPCRHEKTHYVANIHEPHLGKNIEVCDACKFSRSHWEQGESEWVYVQEYAELKKEAENFFLPHPEGKAEYPIAGCGCSKCVAARWELEHRKPS